MSAPKEVAVGSTVYFWFAANTTAGSAEDGATPLYDVRKVGDAAGGAPTASGTPTLLTHANYSDGLHEIAIDTTGYTTGAEYAVFCTLTISSVNPAGFVGSFIVRAAASTLYEVVTAILVDTGTTLDGRLPAALTGAGNIKADALAINGNTIAAAVLAILNGATVVYQGLATGAVTTTTLIDTGLTQADTDWWKGRIIIFTSVIALQATDITGFDPTTDKLTFTAVTAAPTGATYVII